MSAKKIILGWCILGSAFGTLHAQKTVRIAGVEMQYAEIPLYDVHPKANTAYLTVPYARAEIITPYNWSPNERKGKIAYEIDFVYSKFPADTADWVNKYHPLMPNRLNNLFALDPQLKSLPIKWRIVAQTNCTTEPLAQAVFHGFVIRYRYGEANSVLPTADADNNNHKDKGQTEQTGQTDQKVMDKDKNPMIAETIIPTNEAPKNEPKNNQDKEKELQEVVQPVGKNLNDNLHNENTDNKPKTTDQHHPAEESENATKNDITQKNENNLTAVAETKAQPEKNVVNDVNVTPSVNNRPLKNSTDSTQNATSEEADEANDFSDGLDDNADNELPKNKKKRPKPVQIITDKNLPKDTLPTFARNRMPYRGSEENLKDSPDPDVQFRTFYAKRVEEEMKIVEEIIAGRYDLHDSVVFKVLDRHPEWKEMTVVMDWTGSMYPFGAQLIRWHQLNIDKGLVKNLAIFNDGDDYSETSNRMFRKPKPMGKAGGIYYCNPKNVQDVIETMKRTMTAGDGGPDLEENDMEACIKAIEQFPQTEKILLIADKDSYVRDIDLLFKLKVPVYVIVCGFKEGIQPDYLTIAYHTKGGIFDAKNDIDFSQPEKILRRQVIKIDKIKYLFNEDTGRFEVLPRKRFFPF